MYSIRTFLNVVSFDFYTKNTILIYSLKLFSFALNLDSNGITTIDSCDYVILM